MYGVIHATIDAATVTTLYYAGFHSKTATTVGLVVLYNVLAFGLQAVIGPLVDSLRAPRTAGILGSAFWPP